MLIPNISGTGIALVTPFKSDNSIDYEALSTLIDRQISEGANYIVVMGTTAETPTLSPEERIELSNSIVSHVGGRLPLVLGCGGNNTASVISQLSDHMLDSYQAILSVTPYYNKPTQEGLYRHYRALADASPLPVILYNVPGRTGVNLAAETTLRLARECDHIIAIKEASGNIIQVDKIISERPEGFKVISGDDAITLPLIALGADGVISVIANAFTAQFSDMVRKALNEDLSGARELHRSLRPYFRLMTADGNPAGVKALLSRMGLLENVLRLPLVPASKQTSEAIGELLEKGI